MEVSGQLHAAAALFPGKNLLHPLDMRMGGLQGLSARPEEEKRNTKKKRGYFKCVLTTANISNPHWQGVTV
jgi:hypothetical protein